MKICFLDIDGVCNCQNSKSKCGCYVGIDSDKVKRLRTIVEATGAKLVLVSSWKSDWERINKEAQGESGNYLDRKLKKEQLFILDKTTDSKGCSFRGDGILEWLKTLPEGSVENFIILDDEVFDYDRCGLLPHLVQTCFYAENGGLTDEHVEIAIKLLNEGPDGVQHTCEGFICCSECVHAEDCDYREYQDGCYFGEKLGG